MRSSLLDGRVVPSLGGPCGGRPHLWQQRADIPCRISPFAFRLELPLENVNKKHLTSSAPDGRNTYTGCWETAGGNGLTNSCYIEQQMTEDIS